MIERRHPRPRKGERLIGFRPLPGRPLDASGRLILVYQFAGASVEPRSESPTPAPVASAKRSPLKIEQATLL